MSASVESVARTTVPRRVEPGSTWLPPGGVVSIATVTDCQSSTFPAASVDRNSIVWTPSFEWSAGAPTSTVRTRLDRAAVEPVLRPGHARPRVRAGERDGDVGGLRAGRRVGGRRRRRVVDAHVRDRGRRAAVPGDVGRGRADVVDAVGDLHRVPVRARERVPVVRARGRVLVRHLVDARAGVGGRRAERDRPRTVRPGSVIVTAGAVLSTRTSGIGAETAEFPALSVTTTWTS